MKTVVRIYTLHDPRSPDAIRYIGQTKRPLRIRLLDHLTEARNLKYTSHKNNWIRSLCAVGVTPEITLVYETCIEEWPGHERRLIAEYRKNGHALTNSTEGGEGVSNLPEETRKKIAESNRIPMEMRERIINLFDAGWKQASIADEIGVCRHTVRWVTEGRMRTFVLPGRNTLL